jgi:hypothetical protein
VNNCSYVVWRGWGPGADGRNPGSGEGDVAGEEGKVIVVQPRFERVCWCCGRTNGSGAGLGNGRVSCCTGCCGGCAPGFLGLVFSFERKREMMLEIEKRCSDD